MPIRKPEDPSTECALFGLAFSVLAANAGHTVLSSVFDAAKPHAQDFGDDAVTALAGLCQWAWGHDPAGMSFAPYLPKEPPLPAGIADRRGGSKKVNVFLETKFTAYSQGGELISLGMATENGQTFYGEIASADVDRAAPHVKESVLPLLGHQTDCVYWSAEDLAQAVRSWLGQYERSGCIVMYDDCADGHFFTRLFYNQMPGWLDHKNVFLELDEEAIQRYFAEIADGKRHHALAAAQANCFAYRPNISVDVLQFLGVNTRRDARLTEHGSMGC